jgi:aconitate hydratase
MDLMRVGSILKGRHIHPDVSMSASPGSKQVYEMIARNGMLADYISAGVRLLESACGPCIGMGQAPPSRGISIRSFNRNFEGRSGTSDAFVYLASPETCAACAIHGVITDPRKLGQYIDIALPTDFLIDDSMIIPPAEDPATVEVIRGPNIKPLPINQPLSDKLSGEVIIKVGDNITTDHIMPAGAKILPLRSNIPAISEYVYFRVDPEFPKRAREKGGGFIIGGDNYGQGSSREHAALAPMYLGIKAVIVKSFARIHRANLVNFGLIPLIFTNPADYDRVAQGDQLEFPHIKDDLQSGVVRVKNVTQNYEFTLKHDLSPRDLVIIHAGGLLNFTKNGESA